MALIDVRHAVKTYKMGDETFFAMNDISFSINEGEFVAIMGASGSGKSTCMNIIGCLDIPTSGKYILDGIDVSTLSDEELSYIRNYKLGFIFQQYNLIQKLNIISNVELPLIYKRVPKEERLKEMADVLHINWEAIKEFSFEIPIDYIYYFIWLEELYPNYQIDLPAMNSYDDDKYIVEFIKEWNEMKQKRNSREISYEEYMFWKLNYIKKDVDK